MENNNCKIFLPERQIRHFSTRGANQTQKGHFWGLLSPKRLWFFWSCCRAFAWAVLGLDCIIASFILGPLLHSGFGSNVNTLRGTSPRNYNQIISPPHSSSLLFNFPSQYSILLAIILCVCLLAYCLASPTECKLYAGRDCLAHHYFFSSPAVPGTWKVLNKYVRWMNNCMTSNQSGIPSMTPLTSRKERG